MRRQYDLDPNEVAARKFLPNFPWAQLQKDSFTDEDLRGWVDRMVTNLGALNEGAGTGNRDLTPDEKLAFDYGCSLVEFWKREIGKPHDLSGNRNFTPRSAAEAQEMAFHGYSRSIGADGDYGEQRRDSTRAFESADGQVIRPL